ncbi:MAG: hypothetical protein H6582_01225 [Crocinitomicaceae bacterium]|nr:hypothetical protein [Crocinitomicaceae bacterium]
MKRLIVIPLLAGVFLLSAFIFPKKQNVFAEEELDVKFRIQICAYENHVPYNKVEAMRKLGKVMVVKKDGWAYYYSKEYATEAAAITQVPFYISAGFEDAHEVAEVNNQFYSVEEYHKMLKDKEEKESTIHIYK